MYKETVEVEILENLVDHVHDHDHDHDHEMQVKVHERVVVSLLV